jgi:hypothetical protein
MRWWKRCTAQRLFIEQGDLLADDAIGLKPGNASRHLRGRKMHHLGQIGVRAA